MNKNIENPMSAIFKHLAISILFMFVGFLVGQMFIPPVMVFMANKVIVILSIVLLLLCLFSRKNVIPRSFSMNFVYLFTFIDGALMYPLLQYYLQDLGTNVFTAILLSTIILFALLAMQANKKEAGHYLGLGQTLFPILIAMVIASVINIFIGGNTLSIIISCVGVVVFSLYILYDISLIKYKIQNGELRYKNDLSIHVLNLYLDFINILLDLLSIASRLNDN